MTRFLAASMTLLQRRNYPILRVALPFNLLSLRIYLNGISESSQRLFAQRIIILRCSDDVFC